MKTETIRAVYGSEHNACDVIIVHDIDDCGGKWYAIKGSKNINYTTDTLSDGENLERVVDDYTMHSDETVENEAGLVYEVEQGE